MVTVPAIRMQQFGTIFYQAAISVPEIEKLVRFEVLSFERQKESGRKRSGKSRSGVNWEELEKRISGSESAYQRPIVHKKIEELVQYYRDRYEHMDLAPVPGAVILVADRRLDFTPSGPRSSVGLLQLPEEEGLFRTLDGQHRLLALAAYAAADGGKPGVAEALATMSVPAVIFESLAPGHLVEMFVTINTKHTRLKKDVIVTLSGRRLYRDERMAAAHDVVLTLNNRQDSPLYGEIRILGVGAGRVAQAPLATEIENIFRTQEAAGAGAARRFMEQARELFLQYFRQVAQVFNTAWNGRKYSIKSGTALRAFIRVLPDVISVCRERNLDPTSGRALAEVLKPWANRLGDQRFETDGEWKVKSAGGGSRTVDVLTRELRDALRQ